MKIGKKVHDHANRIGSRIGDTLKLLREKGPVVNERLDESPAGIDKLEEIFSNIRTAFASAKTIEKTLVKIGKIIQVTKNKGATSSNNK